MKSTPQVKRLFRTKVSTFLIASATITDSAMSHLKDLQENDATINKSYLANLRARIDTAIKTILGTDNAKDLRKSTADLLDIHANAKYDLGLTKVLIENKYATDPARRDELLNNLGFTSYYLVAANKTQDAMGQLLSRIDNNLTPDLEGELVGKGLPKTRVIALRKYAAIYTNANIEQEGNKDGRKELNDADIQELNSIYAEIVGICKLAQLIFNKSHVLHDSFVFSKVVQKQSSYATGNIAVKPDPGV